MKARRCICFLAIEWGSSPLRSSATLTRPSSMLSTSPALSADNRPPRGTTSLNLNMVHPLVNLLCLRVSDADRPGGGSQDVDVLTCGRSRRRVGGARGEPSAPPPAHRRLGGTRVRSGPGRGGGGGGGGGGRPGRGEPAGT